MKKDIRNVLGAVALSGLAVAGGIASPAYATSPSIQSAASARLAESYGRRPLAFEANLGQMDGRVRFLSRGSGHGLFLTGTEAVVAVTGGTLEEPGRAVTLRWLGGNPEPRVSGEQELAAKSHYLVGKDPRAWRRNIPNYARVRYEAVWPGIDLVFYGNQGRLEYDLVVAPGADPGAARFALEGVDRLTVDAAGDLIGGIAGHEVRFLKPFSYQEEAGGVRREVPSRYRLEEGRVTFDVGAYDPAKPLVIDPVLVYSTYLGGLRFDEGLAITVDDQGYASVTGVTTSPDFPLVHGRLAPDGPPNGPPSDAFVTMFDPAGNVVFSTYLGTYGVDYGTGIAGGRVGGLYVTGHSFGDDAQWSWVAHLDVSGQFLLYWTELFDPEARVASSGIAVDREGQAHVAGSTSYFIDDAWAAKLSREGEILYFFRFGGESGDGATAIAVGLDDEAYVTGFTFSPDFPQIGPPLPLGNGGGMFLTRIDPSGVIDYSSLFGGSGGGRPADVALDALGNVYLTGFTQSASFPTVRALQPSPGGAGDAFIAGVSLPAGSTPGAVLYSTYLGGSGYDEATGIAIDQAGAIHVTGWTTSTDFPLRHPLRGACMPLSGPGRCAADAFVAKLVPGGGALAYSTYLGGSGEDVAHGIAAVAGDAYVTGSTGPGATDAFVVRIAEPNRPPVCSAAAASPAVIWPPNNGLVPVAVTGVTDPEGEPVTITVTGIRQDEPLTGASDAAGVGAARAQVRASRAGGGDGRVYHIAFEARDPQGGSCVGAVTVCVPHDRRPGAACGDGGGVVGSTGG